MKDYIQIKINKKTIKAVGNFFLILFFLSAAITTIYIGGMSIKDSLYNWGYEDGISEGKNLCAKDLEGYDYIDMNGDFTEYVGYYSKVLCTEGCSYLDLEYIGGGWINNYDRANCGCYVKNDASLGLDVQDK